MRFFTARVAPALLALLGLAPAALAQPGPPPTVPPVGAVTVDGTLTDSPYTLLDNSTGGPAPGFGAGHEVNALYASADGAGSLYLGVAGNVQNGNRIVVFLDTKAGGFTSGDFGRTNAPQGVDDFNSGTTFDAGFTADFAVSIGTDGADFYVNVTELGGARTGATPAGNPATTMDRYIGSAIADADVAADTLNGSTTRGFEIRLATSPTGAGADLALDRNSVQMFAAYMSDGAFLSNQFVSTAGSTDGNYGGGAVTFEAATPDPVSYVFQPVAGRKGWRQLAWPVQGGTVGNYAIQNFVQGPGTNFPSGASNVILRYNPTPPGTYQYAASLTDPLESGRGQFWYHYDAADFPGGTPPPGSNFQARPYTLRAGGIEPQGNVVVNAGEVSSTGFMLAGNPFSLDFDTQGITQVSGTGLTIGPLVYVWDPDGGTTGAYVEIDRNAALPADRTVAPMQGFWIESRTAVPTLGGVAFAPQFAQSARVQGNEPLVARLAAQRVLGFRLDRLTDAGPALEWAAARLAFVDGAGEGSDAFDGGLPPSLDAASDARVAFVGADGEFRGQESRAFALDGATEAALALAIAGRPDGAAYRLTWPTMEAVPAEWALTLLDGDTGETVDLRTADHYDFTASPAPWTERFTVRVAARTTASDAAPSAVRLSEPRPNPATSGTRLALTVERAQTVRADLYDALGRHVAVVFDGAVEAERDLMVDTRGLAPGLYVLRVVGDTFVETREVTVAR